MQKQFSLDNLMSAVSVYFSLQKERKRPFDCQKRIRPSSNITLPHVILNAYLIELVVNSP